ncbi:hypothetical protein MKW92_039093 [Papaver armeniacum]|nr:hypothetical protein MKW92_039093 [Papaver armeniacum]
MLSMASSNITTLNGEEGCSDSNSSNSLGGSSSDSRKDISVKSSPSARFKSVVLLPNGSWGTRIYANRKRTWIGTFKSEFEEGKAYDAAAVKLRKTEDSPRNCPLTSSTVASLETDVQKLWTIDEIKSMLKEKLANSCSPSLSLSLGSAAAIMDGDVKYQQLFQKALTPSDVGKLNRLVIHKRFAEKYFPEVSKEEKVPGVIDAIQLSFFDREMKSWNFRYCYWRSSQSYVFTKGWIRFVKEKKLKEKDVVTFYKCECQNGAQKAFYMIDIASVAAETNGGGFAGGFDTDAGNKLDLQLCLGQITVTESGASDRTIKLRQHKEVAPPQPEEEKKKVVRLFGVNIS